jgi:hypothetical protein
MNKLKVMNTAEKTHYRKVFKSDHLGVADLEEFMECGNNDMVFSIAYVRQEIGASVAGKKINANIAYFKEDIKPLVLNATNSKVMRGLTGSSFIEDWKDTRIRLYIDKDAKLMGEVVGGVRVSPIPVEAQKPTVTKDNETRWENAKAAYIRDGNFDAVLKRAIISKENQDLIISECSND